MNILIIILTIIIFLLIVILFFPKKNDEFDDMNKFKPFYYNNINSHSDYINRFYYPYNYPTYFKLGEINVDNGPNKKYDKYINKLNNDHLNKKISDYNYSCPCQKLSN